MTRAFNDVIGRGLSSEQAWEHRRAQVTAALPGTTREIRAATGIPTSAVQKIIKEYLLFGIATREVVRLTPSYSTVRYHLVP